MVYRMCSNNRHEWWIRNSWPIGFYSWVRFPATNTPNFHPSYPLTPSLPLPSLASLKPQLTPLPTVHSPPPTPATPPTSTPTSTTTPFPAPPSGPGKVDPAPSPVPHRATTLRRQLLPPCPPAEPHPPAEEEVPVLLALSELRP
jgi:hypothetical protein